MSAPPLAYARPASLEEAAGLLTEPGARALAGGQSLLPLLARRTCRVDVLVDLLGLPGLDEIRGEGDELRVGALTRRVPQSARQRSRRHALYSPKV